MKILPLGHCEFRLVEDRALWFRLWPFADPGLLAVGRELLLQVVYPVGATALDSWIEKRSELLLRRSVDCRVALGASNRVVIRHLPEHTLYSFSGVVELL